MFHLTQKLSKGLWAILATFSVTASLFSALIITVPAANAADATPKSGGCIGDGVSTGLTSPYSKTSTMCLGDEASSGRRFYQFAVKLEKAIEDVSVTAKSGGGNSISFVKQSDTLFVSKPGSDSMGYVAYTIGYNPPCNEKDKSNIITITTKGPGSDNTDVEVINLCSYKGDSSQSLVHTTAQIKDASGTTTAKTGSIEGNLGVKRTDPLTPDNHKEAKLSKDYVTSFELTGGPTEIIGDNKLGKSGSGGFNLTNGRLTIQGLKPGIYNLKITYNDRAAINTAGGDSNWTQEVKYSFLNVLVKAGDTTWLKGTSETEVYYGSSAATSANSTVAEDTSSCRIDGIGWIICPVMDFLAKIVDAAYKFVTSLLMVQPLLTTGDTAGIYNAWAVIRNIANVAFVIVFLIIIFSQLTSVGVSNYGVKKMIPRLLVAAILVNVSYWLCAIAVDISNIFGASMLTVFDTIANSIEPVKVDNPVFSTSEGWSGITTVVLAGATGIALYVGLSALVPALLAVVVAIMTVFIVLTLRQALIVLLIVVAPLAFVAYLLPNTEEWFTKWRKLFTTLLLMYPIIAALFGISALASTIVMNGATGDWAIAVQIMGATIAILPLAITPLVMKAAGGVLSRIGGIVNNSERGPIDRIKKSAAGYRSNRQEFRKLNALSGGRSLPGYGANVRRKERRKAVLNNRQSELKRSSAEYISGKAETSDRFREQLANGGGSGANQRALDQALNIKATIEAEEVKAATSRIERVVLNKEELQQVTQGGSAKGINGSDLGTRKAAFQQMGARGDFEGMNKAWDTVNVSGDQELRRAFADSMASSSNKPAWMGQGALQSMREGGAGANPGSAVVSSTQLVERAIEANVYSAERIVSTDKDELKIVSQVNNSSTNVTIADKQLLINNAALAQTDPELKAKIGKNNGAIDAIRTNTAYDSAPAAP